MTRPPYLKWRCSIVVTRCAMKKTGTSRLGKDYRVALRWDFHCGCQISKPRSVLDFSQKSVFFFSKSKNELVWPEKVFLVILANIWVFSDNNTTSNSRLTSIKLVCAHDFEELFKNSFVRTTQLSVVLSIPIQINRGTSEAPEIPILERLTRDIQLCDTNKILGIFHLHVL